MALNKDFLLVNMAEIYIYTLICECSIPVQIDILNQKQKQRQTDRQTDFYISVEATQR
jgi:hypothetical protein